jgi:hypothetical protein
MRGKWLKLRGLGYNEETKQSYAVHRDIYLIDTENEKVKVWHYDRNSKKRTSRENSTLGEELSKTRLGTNGSNGRLATEKLQRAIKMHSPAGHLQPLVTYY